MKDAYKVLHQKEAELASVRKEVESLNLVVRLLADDDDQGRFADLGKKLATAVTDSISPQSDLPLTGADRPLSYAAESRLEWPNAVKIGK